MSEQPKVTIPVLSETDKESIRAAFNRAGNEAAKLVAGLGRAAQIVLSGRAAQQ